MNQFNSNSNKLNNNAISYNYNPYFYYSKQSLDGRYVSADRGDRIGAVSQELQKIDDVFLLCCLRIPAAFLQKLKILLQISCVGTDRVP